MRIGIIGYGFVGQAIGWAYHQHDLIIRDPKIDRSAALPEFYNCEAIFICVPSPKNLDGSCDTSILENTLKELFFTNLVNQIPLISKTTAPPSCYKKLQKQYPNLVHSPEFLTERNAAEDYANSEYAIIGGDTYWCEEARAILQIGRNLTHKQHLIVDIETAAFFKYLMNSYLATKVTFMNEFKKLADKENINWNDIILLSSADKRIGKTHMSVPGPDGQFGWGGSCFPKDVSAIIREAVDLELNLELLQKVDILNKKHRNL